MTHSSSMPDGMDIQLPDSNVMIENNQNNNNNNNDENNNVIPFNNERQIVNQLNNDSMKVKDNNGNNGNNNNGNENNKDSVIKMSMDDVLNLSDEKEIERITIKKLLNRDFRDIIKQDKLNSEQQSELQQGVFYASENVILQIAQIASKGQLADHGV